MKSLFSTHSRDTGAVILREPLDREQAETIEVVITVQDPDFNLIPFRREILGKKCNNSFKLVSFW